MKIRKEFIFILFILAIMIISLQAISASGDVQSVDSINDVSSDIVSVPQNKDINSDVLKDIVSSSDNSNSKEVNFDDVNNILGDTSNIIFISPTGNDTNGTGTQAHPYQTISKAITINHENGGGKTIYLKAGNYTEYSLEVKDNITFFGVDKDSVIFNINSNGRAFIIDVPNGNVKIKGISFINCIASNENQKGLGGAILLNNGNLTIENAVFNNCQASEGAAIANKAGTLTIKSSTFENNMIDQTSTKNGGSTIVSYGDLFIDSSTFKNNNANNLNGTIYIAANANIINSKFISNIASNGGAIAIKANKGANIRISGNTFKNNNASSNGGAISIEGSKLTDITGNTFDSNIAKANGGAIDVNDNTNIVNNNFNNNTAVNGGSISLKKGNLTLSKNTITKSNATNGKYINYIDGTISSINLVFLDNSTKKVTDGLYTLYATVYDDMKNPINGGTVTFTSNGSEIATSSIVEGKATFDYSVQETTNYTISGTTSIKSADINTKSGYLISTSAHWYIGSEGYDTLQDAVDASKEGDIIIGLPGTYNYSEIFIGDRMAQIYKNVTIKANKLGDIILHNPKGRVFHVADKNVNNETHTKSALTVVNLIFENNVKNYGGAIYNAGTLTVINCTFRNNTATDTSWSGGAIMSWDDLYVYNSTFIDNKATASGGAIKCCGISSMYDNYFIMDNCSFIQNIAGTYAGAVYSHGLIRNFTNCKFEDNIAILGGAAYFGYGGPVYIKNCNFINNTANAESDLDLSNFTRYGGAFDIARCNLTMINSTFINNSAESGGAISLHQNIMIITTSNYTGYTIKKEIDYYNIINCKFIDNVATYSGGAVMAGYDTVATGEFDNCTFTNNKALKSDGGALANYFSTMYVYNSVFENNTAANVSGAIYTEGIASFDGITTTIYPGNVEVDNSTFNNNHALIGGAIYTHSTHAKVTITGSKFNNNTADIYGGALFNNGSMDIRNSIFNEGYAPTGGAIYSNLTITLIGNKFNNVNSNNETLYLLASKALHDNKFINSSVNFDNYANNYNINIGDNVTINFKLLNPSFYDPDFITKSIYQVYINNVYVDKTEKGATTYTFTPKISGENTIFFIPDSGRLTNTIIINVKGYEDNMDIIQSNSSANNYSIISIVTANNKTLTEGNVKFSIIKNDSVIYSETKELDVTGKANFNYVFEKNGNYIIRAFYSDSAYDVITKDIGVKINSNKANIDIKAKGNHSLGSIVNITVTIDDAGGNPLTADNISFIISKENEIFVNKTYNITDGKINYNYTITDYGNYKITIIYPESADYATTIKSFIYSAGKKLTFNPTIADIEVGKDVNLNFELDPQATGTVQVKINGVTYKTKVTNGKVNIIIPDLAAGDYDAIINYSGDDNFANLTKIVKFSVLPKYNLVANNLVAYYKVGKLTVSLLDGKKGVANQKIVVRINNKDYTLTTNSLGQVSLALNFLPKTYTTKVTYTKGSYILSKNIKVTVKKGKIHFSKISKSVKRFKKFKVRLLDSKNKAISNQKVQIKIGKKIYKVKTNKKGDVYLKIKERKGKYTVKISLVKNNYYQHSKTTKNVILRVK